MMKYLLNAAISIVLSVAVVVVYDREYKGPNDEFEQIIIVDSENNIRGFIGNFGGEGMEKFGLAIFDENGSMRQFIGVAETDNLDESWPQIVQYDDSGIPRMSFSVAENEALGSIGIANDEHSINLYSGKNSSITLVGSGETPGEIGLFSGVDQSTSLYDQSYKTVIGMHLKEEKKGFYIVKNGKRAWEAEN